MPVAVVRGAVSRWQNPLRKYKVLPARLSGCSLSRHRPVPRERKSGKYSWNRIFYYPGVSEPAEYYLSVLLNRQKGHNVLMYSPRGGMEIEKVAEETPDQIFTEEIDPKVGMQPFQARKVAFDLNLSGDAFKNMIKFVNAIYDTM